MIHMRAGTNTDPGLYVRLVNDVVYVYYNGADIPNGGSNIATTWTLLQ